MEKKYTVKEVSELGLIGYKERKIREFLKNGSLKGTQIMSGKRKMVMISESAIREFQEKNETEYQPPEK